MASHGSSRPHLLPLLAAAASNGIKSTPVSVILPWVLQAELKTLRAQVQQQGGQPAATGAAAPALAPAPAGPAGEELYLFGGNNGQWLDSVLCYAPGTNSWRPGGVLGEGMGGCELGNWGLGGM